MIGKEKGITLIALVVTIVVLLILAGITINFVFAEGGLFQRAQDAENTWEQAVQNDLESINALTGEIDKYLNGTGSSNGGTTGGNEGEIEDETTTDVTPESTTILIGWDSNKVTAVKSTDETPITVPIPKGFTPSSVITENTVAGGFVIYEGPEAVTSENLETAKTTRNQFVWIPVTEGKPMFTTTTDEDGNTINIGQLYTFSGTTSTEIEYSSTGYREPDILENTTNGDAVSGDSTKGIEQLKSTVGIMGDDDSTVLANWKEQLQNEFNEMKTSVETYGGFYIGRYETGDLVATKDSSPVVVKENTAINNVNWYYMYQNSKSIVTNTEAKTAGIKSSMIWGSQWDATMNWFLTSEDTAIQTYVTDSTGKGNYTGTQGETDGPIATGSNDNYQANNIYDMAGNVRDWTLEAITTNLRVTHGGKYNVSGSDCPSSYRYYYNPSNSDSYNGSRSTLIM